MVFSFISEYKRFLQMKASGVSVSHNTFHQHDIALLMGTN